ncbi:MAG TPA: HEAT repeat domain-containing protein [Armatimonadota bacterium]|nr:HEAT repeat domain-containing protein [Armatimonadota bacterium]
MPEDAGPAPSRNQEAKKGTRMAEHAARGARASGVMISRGSVVGGFVFLLFFALACAMQVSDLGKRQVSDDHDHDHEAEQKPENDPKLQQYMKAKGGEAPAPGPTESIRHKRLAAEADAAAEAYDEARVAALAQADARGLSSDDARLAQGYKYKQAMMTGDIGARVDAVLHLREDAKWWHHLRTGLQSPRAEIRRACANMLAFAYWPATAPDLERIAQSDPDPDVREAAVAALGTGPRVVSSLDVLESLLRDRDAHIVKAAGIALASIGLPEAIPYLLRAARHPDADVRGQAIAGLYDALRYSMAGRSGYPQEVISDAVKQAFADALSDESIGARRSAVQAITALKWLEQEDRLLAMIDYEKEHDWKVRHLASRALGQLFPQQADAKWAIVRGLRRANIMDPDQSVRFAAMAALREMGYDPGKWKAHESS